MLVALLLSAEPVRPPGLAPDLAPPVHVLAADNPVDVECSGHAAPFVGDIDGDGKLDPIVLKDEIARLQDVQIHYRSRYMSHGYVWLFRRTPAGN
jgi:hypothetical protein